ncbi:hypothetical protein N0V90_011328 [Kalmusia sp. IMI 367209]|nr:hypothetical protein N0V90_011328 [Kalmusia sp. IMI 367209]
MDVCVRRVLIQKLVNSADSLLMPKEPQQKPGGPRQRPVSCKFCRTRKLRCSRESPCSNCLSRGIACELEQAVNNGCSVDDGDKAELLERIRKLEAIVEQNTKLNTLPSQSSPPISNPLSNSLHDHALGTFREAAKQAEKQSTPSPSQQLDQDFAWLESIYDGTDCAVSTPLQVKIPELIITSQMRFRPRKLGFASAPSNLLQK